MGSTAIYDSNSKQDFSSTENDEQSESIFSITAEDSILLMHFLDTIFPLQYPMYTPGILEGGRGWLLALLLRTKPLYYAALALSSYHRWMTIIANEGTLCHLVAVVQQEKHLQACLVELQRAMNSVTQFIQVSRPSSGLGTVTSIVQLVFFEVQPYSRLSLVSKLTNDEAVCWPGYRLANTSPCRHRHVRRRM